jgi:phosphoserine phosphatase RsbU/P
MSSTPSNAHDIERRLIELSDLLEVSQTLNESLDLSATLNHLLLAAMGRFAVGRGLFLLALPPEDGDPEEGAPARYRVALSKGLSDLPAGADVDVEFVPDRPADVASSPTQFGFFVTRRLALVIPLRRAGRCVGLLALGKKLTNQPYEPREVAFLESLAGVASPAIENSRVYEEVQGLNTRLDRKVHELNTLFEIGRKLVGTLNAEEVLSIFSYALMGQLLLTRHLMVLRRPDGQVVRGRGVKLDGDCPWESDAFWELMGSLDKPLRIDAAVNGPLAERKLEAIVPIRKDTVTHGFLGIGARPNGQAVTDDELAFAAALANQAIISLENAWLFEETVEKKRMEEELAIAAAIQRKLFPKALPVVEGYDLAARSTPTRHVGGDYYDAIELGDGRVVVAIADVSGKGTPASLLMSNVQASLRVLAVPGIDLARDTARINELLYANTDFNKYATMFYGVLDPPTGRLTYVNAGHNPPYLLRASGEIETLTEGGLPIGLMPGMAYEQAEAELGVGDLLVLYTDGVSEAVNGADEEFGEPKVEELARAHVAGGALEVLDAITGAVAEFAHGLPQMDDITMVVVKRLG